MSEADFWSWVASEKRRLDTVLDGAEEEIPTLIDWLEREINAARETAFSLSLRGENGSEYWSDYADALEDLLHKIERREVRA